MTNLSQETMYDIATLAFYALSGGAFLGISASAPAYAETLDLYIRIYTCAFLIYRFNPFRHGIRCTKYDQKIIFAAGLLILMTTAISRVTNKYIVEPVAYTLSTQTGIQVQLAAEKANAAID